MSKQSAGILPYRLKNNYLELLIVHPGGPFWKNKDLGAWSVPKGEFADDEEPFDAAKREFKEEIGFEINGQFIELDPVRQKGGKTILAWACESDFDPTKIKSNTFELEWPPKSGKIRKFPEVDSAQWFTVSVAKKKINKGQAALIDDLINKLDLKQEQVDVPNDANKI